jgi:hypothetical protein
MLLGAGVGIHPLWPDTRPNPSEAAALADFGALSQWADAHADMKRRYRVGADVYRSFAIELTPFEAAISAQQSGVVSFLASRGIHPRPEDLPRLRCLALLRPSPEALEALGGAPDAATCNGQSLPWQ